MDWNSFSPLFHDSWHDKVKPFIESKECDKIYAYIKKESARGKKIAPLSSDVFKAFYHTTYDDIKVILVGLSPYHTFYNGFPIANGLLMDCSITGKLQPSLLNFYKGLEDEFGVKESKRPPDISYIARQGVLMFNVAFTTELRKPGNHVTLWEPFIKYLFEEVIITNGIPVVFLGKEAARIGTKYLTPFTWIFTISHPASASYRGDEWSTEGTFTQVNKIIKGNNNTEIEWLKL